jgi:hypothetical protein
MGSMPYVVPNGTSEIQHCEFICLSTTYGLLGPLAKCAPLAIFTRAPRERREVAMGTYVPVHGAWKKNKELEPVANFINALHQG